MNSIESNLGLGGVWVVGIAIGAGSELVIQAVGQVVISLL